MLRKQEKINLENIMHYHYWSSSSNQKEKKEIWTYDDIITKYEEEISITVHKHEKSKNGYCNIQISTGPIYMEKCDTYFYKRSYSGLTVKAIEKAEESLQQKKESEKIDDLDL